MSDVKRSELVEYGKALPGGNKHGMEFVPHDQIAGFLDARYPTWLRVWACIALHQFPRRHRDTKRPYAMPEGLDTARPQYVILLLVPNATVSSI